MSKQVMKQALDALTGADVVLRRAVSDHKKGGHYAYLQARDGTMVEATGIINAVNDAITTLRAALDAPEPYDQQALEPCNVCGWKAIVPGEPCLMCERNAQMLLPEREPLSDARIMNVWTKYVDYLDDEDAWVLKFARAIEQEVGGK